jgi:hypothetical protein
LLSSASSSSGASMPKEVERGPSACDGRAHRLQLAMAAAGSDWRPVRGSLHGGRASTGGARGDQGRRFKDGGRGD